MLAKLLGSLRRRRTPRTLADQFPPTSPVRGPTDTIRLPKEFYSWTAAQKAEWLRQVRGGPPV